MAREGEPAATERGHASLPHTADLRIEAWGPSRAECLSEAVYGLVEAFADVGNVAASQTVPVALGAGSHEELLASVLEEVIYLLDVFGQVPVHAAFEETEEGGVAGSFDVAPLHAVEVVGPQPKAVAASGLEFGPTGEGHWRCRFTVDV